MANETLFTDILTRLRPGYKVGGVVTTPKRGLVNQAGSYAGKPLIGDGTTEGVNKLYKKMAQEYDQVLQTAVDNRDFRNVPEFKEWAVKNYGPEFAKKHYRKNVTKLSKLKYFDTQNKLLDTLIEEANQGLKYQSLTDLQQQAGYSKKTAGMQGKAKYGKLDTAGDKLRKGFDYLYGNPNKPVSELFDSFKQLKEITGLNVGPSKYLKGYAPYEENKRVIKNLSTILSKQRLARNPNLTLGELQFRVQNKVKDADLFSPPRQVTIETKIMDFAKRHVEQGGKKIKWLIKPGKTKRGYPDYSKAKFKYNGQTYDLSRLIQSADVDPNFKELFKVEDEIKALNAKKVIHPKTKKIVRFDDLMRETYGYTKAPYAVDHFKQVANEPFTSLRILPTRVNSAAGTTFQFGEEFITDPRKKQKYTKVGKEKILKKIGYNYQKPLNQLIKDELNLAEDVLVKGRKLRSPAAIVDELDFSETPTTNIKPKVSTQPTLSSDTFGVRTAIEEGPSAVKKLGSLGARGLAKALYPAGIALEGYFMNEARKQGKSYAEILAMPLMLEGRVAELQDMLKLAPVERQAYNRENIEQDYSMLDTDFYTPNLEGIETIDNAATKNYLRQERALEEAIRAEKRAAPKQRFTLPNITGIVDDEV